MSNSAFFHFLLLLLYRYKSKHIGAVLISSLIVALLSAVLFISASIQQETRNVLETQPDFVVQKIRGGERVNLSDEWLDEIREIHGVSTVTPRLYGHYYFTPNEEHFLLYGVDLFDEQSHKSIHRVIEETNIKTLLAHDQMVIGEGVQRFLEKNYYDGFYNFRNPDGEVIKVTTYGTFDRESNIISNEMIVMEMDLLRSIFGLEEGMLTDIAFNVPNEAEFDNIITKLHLLHYDIRVITKEEVAKAYQNLYNYKGGLFLLLYLIVILTFIMILYQRYSMVYSSEKKEIGILRAVGWSIKDIIKLKFFESIFVALMAYFSGIIMAYYYVFIFGAPLLSGIFLGTQNLQNSITFAPVIDFGLLGSIFLFFVVPFMAAVLIPAWKIAVTEPKEAMK